MALTPTYHVFDMMRHHMGARLLPCDLDCPTFDAHPVGLRKKHSVPTLSASASIAGNKVLLSVANQTPDRDVLAQIVFHNAKPSALNGRILNATSPGDANTPNAPKNVAPKRFKIESAGPAIEHVFPAHSFTSISITLS